MTNADRKAAIRERMARTGENYTTAKRAIERGRGRARERVSPQSDRDLERAVYAAYDRGTVAGFLAQELFSTAVWREGKAAEYPDDDRNLAAATHLANLAREILALPDDDPRILRMESAVQVIADANGELPATSEITRTIGFSWGYPTLDDLLDRYVQEQGQELMWLKQYLLTTEGEGATPAVRRISEALDIKLDEVLAAIQKLGSRVPAASLSGAGTLTASGSWVPAASLSGTGTLIAGAPVPVGLGEVGSAIESLEVVRTIDIDELSEQASRGGLAKLSANQRLLIAVLLITAILPALPPEVRHAISDEVGFAAAIAVVLGLFKR